MLLRDRLLAMSAALIFQLAFWALLIFALWVSRSKEEKNTGKDKEPEIVTSAKKKNSKGKSSRRRSASRSQREDIWSFMEGKVVRVHPWRWVNGEFETTSMLQCDAVSIPSTAYPKERFGSSKSGESGEVALFSKRRANEFADTLVKNAGFVGRVTKSVSGEKWTIWRISRSEWKRKRARYRNFKGYKSRASLPSWYYDVQKDRHPELRGDPHANHWIDLAHEVGCSPEDLRANLD